MVNDGKAYRLSGANVFRHAKGQIVVDPNGTKVIENGIQFAASMTGSTATIVVDDCNGNQVTTNTKTVYYNNGVTNYSETTVCFTAGTKVNTENGLVNIEDIKVGDRVLSWDEETGEYDYKPVSKTFINTTDEYVRLDIGGEIIEATPKHPFRTFDGQWIASAKLEVGQEVLSYTGEKQVVNNVELVEEETTVYNLEIEGWYTYLVGENGIVVHNECVVRNWIQDNVRITFKLPTGGWVTVSPNYKKPDGTYRDIPLLDIRSIGGTAGIGLGGMHFEAGVLSVKADLTSAYGSEIKLEQGRPVSRDVFAQVSLGLEGLASYGFEVRRAVSTIDNLTTYTIGHKTSFISHHADVTFKSVWDQYGELYNQETWNQYFKIPFTDIKWSPSTGWTGGINVNVQLK